MLGNLWGSYLHLILKMASVQVIQTPVANNSSSQDSSYADDHFQSSYVTPGFKPFSQFEN